MKKFRDRVTGIIVMLIAGAMFVYAFESPDHNPCAKDKGGIISTLNCPPQQFNQKYGCAYIQTDCPK